MNEEIDLNNPGALSALKRKLKHDIDSWIVETYSDPHRWHLGASIIGNECSRYLWYTYRWFASETFDARMLRLFNRGHREEERMIEFLRGIGAEVWTHDENNKQFKISAVMEHFGGSLDGVLKLPARYNIPKPILTEFKTNGTGKGFVDTVSDGVQVAKPQHWAQMSTYGFHMKLEYAAYFIINKNDDDLDIQIVKLDWKLGEQMTAKAERIILSQTPPPKLSLSPTFFKCTYCPMKYVCHENKKPELNCRSCKYSVPTFNGEFNCTKHNGIIPRDFVKQGCGLYEAIPNE